MNLPTPVISDNSRRIIGESAPMQVVLRQVAQVAPTNATVLITGETGVGKDVIAQAIHEGSPRKNRPFKAVNCGAFYQDLLQSELFGHEKGAFTGATNQRRGVFEQADAGTLFLDEVAEMSPEVQVKFLRVLETQEFTRLGGERNIKVNVRIIAATNVNLATSVRQKKFRQDLYYRLNLFRIQIPPLRDRREDIPLFVSAFIPELSAEHGKPITGITSEALDYLQNADWYGNVRELRNAIESAIISATTEELQLKDFPMDPEAQQVSLVPVQTSGTQLVDATPTETDLLDEPGGALQVVDTAAGAIATGNMVSIYKTILGLILSAIRLLEPAATANNEVPFLIPDEDTSWMQISDTDDAAEVLKKALEILSTIAKTLEYRAQEGVLPIAAPMEQRGGSQGEYLPVLDEEEVIGRVGMTMAEIERAAIQKTLAEADGNKTEAAKILDIGVRTLHRKLDAYKQETNSGSD
ncbi:AAA domain-containing protein [Candidatus Poribacteria bacterium]|nr:AAA domain-containing protein [Candidatus Poribacteria bacterium]MYK96259.1 AAA domain-containing protein [Candidatus Poribacteria bacterium]